MAYPFAFEGIPLPVEKQRIRNFNKSVCSMQRQAPRPTEEQPARQKQKRKHP
jgi:hypothetical protein